MKRFFAVIFVLGISAVCFCQNSITSQIGIKNQVDYVPQKRDSIKTVELKPEDRVFTVNGVSFTMIYVKAGSFIMGYNERGGNMYTSKCR